MLSLSDQLTNEMPETFTTTQFQESKTARHHLSSNRTFFVSRQKQKHFSFYKYKRHLIYLFRTILFSVYRRRCSAEPPIAENCRCAAGPQIADAAPQIADRRSFTAELPSRTHLSNSKPLDT